MNKDSALTKKLASVWIALFLSALLLVFAHKTSAFDTLTGPWLTWNEPADRNLCPEIPTFAWVEHDQGGECIRYFPGKDIRNAPLVIAQFYGDRDQVMRLPPGQIRNNTRRSQEGYAVRQSERAGVPVMIVARPGTYGSSGDHGQRRQPREYLSLNAALDRIKERYGIQNFILLGHSGGATSAAGLLTLGRADVHCAVLSSGAFALLRRAEMLRRAAGQPPRPGLDTTGLPNPYDPLDHVHGIVPDPTRQIIMLANPHDKVAPFILQLKFATALLHAGHQVRFEEHPAQKPSFHNLLGNVAVKAAGRCAWAGSVF